jgi:hypothetical protein
MSKVIELGRNRKPKKFNYKDIQRLAGILCRKEGKKSKVKIGDIREVLKLLALEMADNIDVLYDLGAYSDHLAAKKTRA